MGMFDFVTDLFEGKDFLEVATSVAGLATTGAAIYSTVQQVGAAKEAAELQAEEYRRQQQLATLEAKRSARIATANVIAQQAATGATLSTTAGRVAGIQTDLTSGIADLEEATAFNINQLGLQVSDIERQATAGIVSGVFTAGLEAIDLFDIGEEPAKSPFITEDNPLGLTPGQGL